MGLFQKICSHLRPKAPVPPAPPPPPWDTDARHGIKGTNGLGSLASENPSDIQSFRYSYDGTIGGNNFSYELRTSDEGYTFIYASMEHPDYGEMSADVPSDLAVELKAAYSDCRVFEWDGFHKYVTNVCDGSGFSIWFSFLDGNSMSASGTNCEPARYYEFETRMKMLFSPYVARLLSEGRQRRIETGVSGKLVSIYAHFLQQGTSGHDDYEIRIDRETSKDKNVSIRWKSDSNEYFPTGSHQYELHIPDADAGFSKIEDLIREYRVIEWYDHNKADPDYNNREWFQIGFHFENGSIRAMGTAYPEHYSEVRHELLTVCATVVHDALAQREKGAT